MSAVVAAVRRSAAVVISVGGCVLDIPVNSDCRDIVQQRGCLKTIYFGRIGGRKSVKYSVSVQHRCCKVNSACVIRDRQQNSQGFHYCSSEWINGVSVNRVCSGRYTLTLAKELDAKDLVTDAVGLDQK